MLLHYFSKKENNDKKIANLTYKNLIEFTKILKNQNNLRLKNDFQTTFELSSIFLFIIFFSDKKKKSNKKINQFLINIYIKDLDYSLREIGIGDMSIGKYVKTYLKKLYYRFNKLEKIFLKENQEEFYRYIDKINIQKEPANSYDLSIYFFSIIIKLLKKAETEDLSEFDIKKIFI